MLKHAALALLLLLFTFANAQLLNRLAIGNPLLPGYFADPSIFQDNGKFYIYSTTDGYDTGGFTSGPFGVWYSSDVVNWTFKNFDYPANFPFTNGKLWAPSVTKGANGKCYMYYVKDGYNCFVASSISLLGPWKAENDGKPIYPSMFDTEAFKDDDGSVYLVFQGPKVNNVCAIYMGKLKPNMTQFESKPKLIYQNFDLFEAPYLFKRNGKYYLLYSNGSLAGSYHVNAAYAGSSVWGPYLPHNIKGEKYDPILEPDIKNDISATGHNSVFKIDTSYFIVYHRRSYPYKKSMLSRQVCIDKLGFDGNGRLLKTIPTVQGVNPLNKIKSTENNLAFGKITTASSKVDPNYKAAYATDGNNGTLWKAAANTFPQVLQVDLGNTAIINKTSIAFEYFTEAYQYKIETSVNGTSWKSYAEKITNALINGPVIAIKKENARYVRLVITGSSKKDQAPGVWEFSIY